ncbi:MAG TPA: FISUMP domain-containing protein [Bacteroidales bacterium]|nr:FISUMP domain-containing protein [Bacteroidales bacterium]
MSCEREIPESPEGLTNQISSHPNSQQKCEGESVTFSVTVKGIILSYQWKKNDTNILGANDSTYTISSVSTSDAGNYTCYITSTSGNITSNQATLTVNPPPTAPSSVSASPNPIWSGSSTTLSCSGGSGTTFKWYTGSCGGTYVGQGQNLSVSPTSTTKYYGRWENSCGNSSCKNITVTVSTFTCGTSTITYNGVTYNTVQIGSQCWLKENLKTTHYNDGTSIPNVTDNAIWETTTSGAYCCYDNNPSNCNTYGALYNWYAVNTDKLCPNGWHVPSDAEWTTLVNYLGGASVAGGALKEAGTSHWSSPNTSATNSSGFSALPGGNRYGSDGSFYYLGSYGYWWSSTEYDGSNAWSRLLAYDFANVYRYYSYKRVGFSVRCLRD